MHLMVGSSNLWYGLYAQGLNHLQLALLRKRTFLSNESVNILLFETTETYKFQICILVIVEQ